MFDESNWIDGNANDQDRSLIASAFSYKFVEPVVKTKSVLSGKEMILDKKHYIL